VLSMQEARDLAARLFDHFDVEPIVVQRPQHGGTRSGMYFYPRSRSGKPARIELRDDAPDWMVCHEVAHHVAHNRGHRGHGPEWAAIYVEAVEAVISEPYADRLHRAMTREGLVPAERVTYGRLSA
jgi:hypothetical protein